MSKQKIKTKKRGIFLTLIIVYIFINLVESVFNLSSFNQTYKLLYNPIPFWLLPLALIADILEVIGVYGIIKWKKWGAYSIFASVLLSWFSCFFVSQQLLGIVITTSIVSIVLVWAIYRKWNNFE